eukprot:14998060-Alexandrium_andersonii.AAC.1
MGKLRAGWFDLERRPWGLRKNGDMWAVLDALVRQRGHESICLEKVKSHCGREDVDAGIISARDRLHNERVDRVADRARELAPKWERVWAWIDRNVRKFEAFFVPLQRMFCRLFVARAKLLEDPLRKSRLRNAAFICVVPTMQDATGHLPLRRHVRTLEFGGDA